MKPLATVGVIGLCAWVGYTHPILAIIGLGGFLLAGAVYEAVRNQP